MDEAIENKDIAEQIKLAKEDTKKPVIIKKEITESFEFLVESEDFTKPERWEDMNVVPGRLVRKGLSHNGFNYDGVLQTEKTAKHFENAKFYINHQPKSEMEEGSPRKVQDLAGKWKNVRNSASGNLIGDLHINNTQAGETAKRILFWDNTAVDNSIVSSAKCQEMYVDDRYFYDVQEFCGSKPSCDLVTEGSAGGGFTQVYEAKTKTDEESPEIDKELEEERGTPMEFKDMSLEEQKKLIIAIPELVEVIVSENVKDDSQTQTQLKSLTQELKKVSEEKNSVMQKLQEMEALTLRKEEIISLREQLVEYIDGFDWGETGAKFSQKKKDKYIALLKEAQKNKNPLPTFEMIKADVDETLEIVQEAIKATAAVDPARAEDFKSTTKELSEEKKNEMKDKVIGMFKAIS